MEFAVGDQQKKKNALSIDVKEAIRLFESVQLHLYQSVTRANAMVFKTEVVVLNDARESVNRHIHVLNDTLEAM